MTLLHTHSTLVFLQNAMLVKAAIEDSDTSLARLCTENSDARDLFSIWIACGKDIDIINNIKNRYHPSDVQFVGDKIIFVSERQFVLLDKGNISWLSDQPLAADNQMLLYGSENEFFLKRKVANHDGEQIKYYSDDK